MPRDVKLNLKRRAQAARLHAKGVSPAEVGRHLGITTAAAHSLLWRAGVDPGRLLCSACRAPVSTFRRILRGPRSRAVLCLACLKDRPDATFAERLRALRNAAGLTQAELARKAKVAEGNIAAYEAGGAHPRPDLLARLASVLGPRLLEGREEK